jgi:triosephosphate isomerase
MAAGNWKMNKTSSEAVAFINQIKEKIQDFTTEVLVCVPFTCLAVVLEATKGSKIKVGSQNMHFEEKGAFTGEISASMLTELGVEYVIIGHSERRQYFCETDETVNKKLIAAFGSGLKPIVCVGESLAQREQGVTDELVRYQTKIALQGLTSSQVKELVIAYEPIWAIGTGRTATSQQAQDVIFVIRNLVKELYDEETATAVRILYGGSVTAENSNELFSMPDIDGGLVGGASLKPDDFSRISSFKA